MVKLARDSSLLGGWTNQVKYRRWTLPGGYNVIGRRPNPRSLDNTSVVIRRLKTFHYLDPRDFNFSE